MNYEELSHDAKNTLLNMVEFCLNNKLCLGMDEGIADFNTMIEHEFVTELRNFICQQDDNLQLLVYRCALSKDKAGDV